MSGIDPRAVSNAILDWADVNGIAVSQLKLQKVLYFCHAKWLVHRREPLVSVEFQAWEYGPVSKIVYDSFKHYNDRAIVDRAIVYDVFRGHKSIAKWSPDASETEFLEKLLEEFMSIPANKLVEMTHVVGGPWECVWNGKVLRPNMKITNDLIYKYFIREIAI